MSTLSAELSNQVDERDSRASSVGSNPDQALAFVGNRSALSEGGKLYQKLMDALDGDDKGLITDIPQSVLMNRAPVGSANYEKKMKKEQARADLRAFHEWMVAYFSQARQDLFWYLFQIKEGIKGQRDAIQNARRGLKDFQKNHKLDAATKAAIEEKQEELKELEVTLEEYEKNTIDATIKDVADPKNVISDKQVAAIQKETTKSYTTLSSRILDATERGFGYLHKKIKDCFCKKCNKPSTKSKEAFRGSHHNENTPAYIPAMVSEPEEPATGSKGKEVPDTFTSAAHGAPGGDDGNSGTAPDGLSSSSQKEEPKGSSASDDDEKDEADPSPS